MSEALRGAIKAEVKRQMKGGRTVEAKIVEEGVQRDLRKLAEQTGELNKAFGNLRLKIKRSKAMSDSTKGYLTDTANAGMRDTADIWNSLSRWLQTF